MLLVFLRTHKIFVGVLPVFLVLVLLVSMIASNYFIEASDTYFSVGIQSVCACVGKPCYWRRAALVIGGTLTQVFADSRAIAASTLNHCTT